jgi:hypothetical protein
MAHPLKRSLDFATGSQDRQLPIRCRQHTPLAQLGSEAKDSIGHFRVVHHRHVRTDRAVTAASHHPIPDDLDLGIELVSCQRRKACHCLLLVSPTPPLSRIVFALAVGAWVRTPRTLVLEAGATTVRSDAIQNQARVGPVP